MINSLKETEEIEKYLHGELQAGDKLLFESRMLLNRTLRENVLFQRMTYRFIHFFHRRKLKKEIEALHHDLFSDPTKVEFQQKILQYFNH